MLDLLQRLGATALGVAERMGRGHLFLLHVLVGFPALLLRFGLVIKQLFSVGVLSLLIIAVSGLFVGMVLALQGYNTLVDFGATESLGVMVALSLVRELGPVVAALLFAGRAGSALTAEIGLMKATEQLSAMEMMAVDRCIGSWRRVLWPVLYLCRYWPLFLVRWVWLAVILWRWACWVWTMAPSGRRCRTR